MSFPDRPPLHPIALEQIDMLLHKMDERHWPLIAEMRVKNYYPPSTPVPPQSPEHLRQQIHWYASSLFKTEADQYEQFRSDVRYGTWLSGLTGRIISRVMKNLDLLENSDTSAIHGLFGIRGGLILGYHGLTTQEVEKSLHATLLELCDQYQRGIAPGQRSLVAAPHQPSQVQSEPPKPVEASHEESLAKQLQHLKGECDTTAEEMSEAIGVVPRSVFKHLAGDAVPRRKHLAAYAKFFSDRLGRTVTFQKVRKKSSKGHNKGT